MVVPLVEAARSAGGRASRALPTLCKLSKGALFPGLVVWRAVLRPRVLSAPGRWARCTLTHPQGCPAAPGQQPGPKNRSHVYCLLFCLLVTLFEEGGFLLKLPVCTLPSNPGGPGCFDLCPGGPLPSNARTTNVTASAEAWRCWPGSSWPPAAAAPQSCPLSQQAVGLHVLALPPGAGCAAQAIPAGWQAVAALPGSDVVVVHCPAQLQRLVWSVGAERELPRVTATLGAESTEAWPLSV